MSDIVTWKGNRSNYSAARVRVTEVKVKSSNMHRFKAEGYVKHKWWYKYKWKKLDNNYNPTDVNMLWSQECVIRYTKLWLEYFKNPDKYDVDVPSVIFDEEIITPESHLEHFVWGYCENQGYTTY